MHNPHETALYPLRILGPWVDRTGSSGGYGYERPRSTSWPYCVHIYIKSTLSRHEEAKKHRPNSL